MSSLPILTRRFCLGSLTGSTPSSPPTSQPTLRSSRSSSSSSCLQTTPETFKLTLRDTLHRILADMFTGAVSNPGFNWSCSPACTELEMIVTDWSTKMFGLDKGGFLGEDGVGGGCIMVRLPALRPLMADQILTNVSLTNLTGIRKRSLPDNRHRRSREVPLDSLPAGAQVRRSTSC